MVKRADEAMERPLVAVLGFGEVGRRFSFGLAAAGVRVHAYRRRRPQDDGLSEEGLTVSDDLQAVLAEAEVVLSVVTPRASLEVARAAASFVTPGALYVDLNSSTPGVKRDVAATLGDRVDTVDGCIVGLVALDGHRTPVLASGPAADRFAKISAGLGMRVSMIGPVVGQAAAHKLCRTLFMKGLIASLEESLVAADAQGIADAVLADVAETLRHQDFRLFAEQLVATDGIHAGRRAEELTLAIDFVSESGMTPIVALAARERLARTAAANLGQSPDLSAEGAWLRAVRVLREHESAIGKGR